MAELPQRDRAAALPLTTGRVSVALGLLVVAAAGCAPPARDESPPARGVSTPARAEPGVPVPAFELRDQDDRPVTMATFAGRVVVVTFVFTRCPMPDFCPLMVSHLERIRRRADEEGIGGRLALLGVTLDPDFDSPAVLRAYGETVLKGTDRFDHWTLATGPPEQIQQIAQFFGIGYRADGGLVTHTLATAVVGADGRVMRVFPSNSWTPDEVFERVRQGVDLAARR